MQIATTAVPLLLIPLLACDGDVLKPVDAAPPSAEFRCEASLTDPDHTMALILDDTGSFGAVFEASRRDAQELVRALPPSTWLQVQLMTADSFGPPAFSAFIPSVDPLPPCTAGPWDRGGKEHCKKQALRHEAQLTCASAAKQRIVAQFSRLAPHAAKYTDVYGALAAAEWALQSIAAADQQIVVWSDLVHTAKQSRPRDYEHLQDTEIIVRASNTEASQNAVHAFQSKARDWGARFCASPVEVPWSAGHRCS